MLYKTVVLVWNSVSDRFWAMEETDRSYLLKEDVETLMLLKPSKSRYELVKDLFIFSCFTGLSYIDIKKLKWSNIQSFFDGHQGKSAGGRNQMLLPTSAFWKSLNLSLGNIVELQKMILYSQCHPMRLAIRI